MERSRLLQEWFASLTEKQIFFAIWLLIAGFFVGLILHYQKKMSRRNFREDAGPRFRVDPRRLKDSNQAKDLAVRRGRIGIKNSYPTGKGSDR